MISCLSPKSCSSRSRTGHLRCLLRGVPDDQPVALGAFFHVALWRELLQQASCSDVDLVDQIMAGMPIVGDIASSHRWAGPIGNLMLITSPWTHFVLGPGSFVPRF